MVWDTHVPDSLKDATREKRGQEFRWEIAGQTKIPKNWMMFLREPDIKSEIFSNSPLTEHCTLHLVSNSSKMY